MCEECKLLRPQVEELQEKMQHLCAALLMRNHTSGGQEIFTEGQRTAFAESVPIGRLPVGGGSLEKKPMFPKEAGRGS